MAQIYAKWPKSEQNGPNPSKMAKSSQNLGTGGHNVGVFWQDLGHYAWNWAILLRYGPYCLDLGYLAKRTNGRTDGRMDGWTDSSCVLQDFVPFGAAALLLLNLNHTLLKHGMGTADYLLPLGCYYLCCNFRTLS